MDILDAIGNTSLVRLRKVVPPGCADILVKLEWENPTGSMKDRMALAVISRAEADGRLRARRHRRRVHRRQHGRVARAGLRGQGLPHPDRQLGRVQPGKAGSDGGAGRGADARPERRRPHHQEADPGHDRSRAGAEPGAAHLLDRPAQQPRQHRRLLPAGRGDLDPDGGRRSTRSCTASGRRRPRAAWPRCSSGTSRASGSSWWSRPSPRCCWAARRGRTRSRASGSATRLRCGSRRLVDEILPIATDDAKAMARRLAREEGVFAGTSSGANVLAAIRVGRAPGPGRHGGDADGRLRPQVPGHRRVRRRPTGVAQASTANLRRRHTQNQRRAR